MNKKTTELKTMTISGEVFDGAVTVSEISQTDGTWRCTYERDFGNGLKKTLHESLVIAPTAVDATIVYRSMIPSNLRGAFDPKPESIDCKHCNAPVGECDGNCDALPNELDDASENVG